MTSEDPNDSNCDKTHPKRWRFSLQTFLIAISVVGVPLSFHARNLRNASQQKSAIETLRDAGVHVDYTADPWDYPDWQLQAFGHDYLSGVEGVLIYGRTWAPNSKWSGAEGDGVNPDSDLNSLIESACSLTSIMRIRIEDVSLTRDCLTPLRKTRNLTWLSLCRTDATDRDLAIIRDLPNLERLDLKGTNISDDTIEHLLTLRHLVWLRLQDTQLSDSALTRLKLALPDCEIE